MWKKQLIAGLLTVIQSQREDYKLLDQKLDRIYTLLLTVEKEEQSEMATLAETLAETRRATTIETGIEALVKGLRDAVAALPGIPAEAQAQIDEIFTALQTNNTAAEAVLSGTGVPPTAPPTARRA